MKTILLVPYGKLAYIWYDDFTISLLLTAQIALPWDSLTVTNDKPFIWKWRTECYWWIHIILQHNYIRNISHKKKTVNHKSYYLVIQGGRSLLYILLPGGTKFNPWKFTLYFWTKIAVKSYWYFMLLVWHKERYTAEIITSQDLGATIKLTGKDYLQVLSSNARFDNLFATAG